MNCIVCEEVSTQPFSLEDKKYWRCEQCFAVFLDKKARLSFEEEKIRYEQHDNNILDEDYRKFLSKLFKPMKNRINPRSRGLDFGCGSGPALAEMFKEEGFIMDLYDPFFYPNKSVFHNNYDFITCTEAAEHFFEPAKEFYRLDKMLLEGGFLGVMTTFMQPNKDFNHWHYRRDPTHVVFYQEETFGFIASKMNWSYEIPQKDVVLFNK